MNDLQIPTPKKPRLTKRQKNFIAALDKNLGNVSDASKKTGISRDSHYTWIKTNSIYEQEVERIKETVLDFTESCLHKQIQEGDTTAIIFKLKCLGKTRGYIEKQQIEISDVTKLSDEELTSIVNSKS